MFLKEQRKEEKIEEGKRYLEKELLRFNKELPSKDTRVDDVAVRLAEGDIKIFAAIKELFPDLAVFRAESRKKKIETNAIHHDISSIRVNGVEDIMVHTKNCCQPYTTDSIVGFVSKGSGVVIHTLDCPVIKRVDPKRLIDVHWSDDGIG
ncbi:MAG: hypothetical protein U9Q15_04290 [Patescibacteria group bacterium]|nr:hypothetical protein [Patescibacteria group bacterium]